MIDTPINIPAFNSNSVMPPRLRIENAATIAAAAAKRSPTKNIGPLAVSAFCTNKKVMPHTMVIRISTHSALLKREVKDSSLENFNGVATLRAT